MDVSQGSDGLVRCAWAGQSLDYQQYHDQEWGVPVYGEHNIFERIVLEGFQSGLSWLTILRKRAGFRQAFAGFDPELVADFTEADQARLLGNPLIVRNRAKIAATIVNARAVLGLRSTGGLEQFFWSFAPTQPTPRPSRLAQIPTTTPSSIAMSKALRAKGFTFIGPVTAYAAMQACGLVDDHLVTCHVPIPLGQR